MKYILYLLWDIFELFLLDLKGIYLHHIMWSQYDENINENPFFQDLSSNHHDILEKVIEEGWIICIPRIGNLETSQISIELILDHVLLSQEEHCPGTYITLSSKILTVKEKQIFITGESASCVQILFEETHYTENKSKYIIWCVDKPLFFDTNKSPAPNIHNDLRTLNDCIDFLWCESLGHSIFEHIQKITTDFIDTNPDYEFEGLQNQKEILGSVYSRCLQAALKNEHLSRKSSDDNFLRNLKIAVESFMQSCLSRKLINSINTSMCEYDAYLNKIIQNSSELQIRDLGISTNFCDVITSARCELNNLNRFGTVLDKVNCLRVTFETITNKNGYAESICISSDILLQIFIFLILKLRINNWVANLTYIKTFHFSIDLINEDSFLVSTLEAAIEYIKSNDFFDKRTKFIYGDTSDSENNGQSFVLHQNNGMTDHSSVISKAFSFVRLGQLDNLISLLNDNKTYEKTNKELCHPLCSCEHCIELVKNNIESSNLTVEAKNDKEQTLLHIAALFDQGDIVEYLLNEILNPNCRDFLGRTPLHYAAMEGSQGILLLLMNHENIDVNARDNNGNTPLILACNNGQENCVKAFLYSCPNINVNLSNNYGDTALHLASKWGYISIVKILFEYNASVRVKNKRNEIPINLAQNCHITRLLNLFGLNESDHLQSLKSSEHDIKTVDNSSLVSSDNSHKEHGIKPTNIEQLKKIDLLLKAIENNDLPLTCFYLGFCNPDSGKSASFGIENKCHPLCNCDKCYALENNYEIINVPRHIKHVSVNYCNCDGYTPLHIAAKYGRTDILRLLLDSGALPNLKTFKKLHTALHLACINQRLQIVKVLLSTAKCDVNAKDANGNSGLYYACIRNDVRIAELLISNGADFNYKNKEGKTILQEVHDRMLVGMFKLLRDHSKLNFDRATTDILFI